MTTLSQATRTSLDKFVKKCDSLIVGLDKTYKLEMKAGKASNNFVEKWALSTWSDFKKNNIAEKVDKLYQKARTINKDLADQGLPPAILRHFDGDAIKVSSYAHKEIAKIYKEFGIKNLSEESYAAMAEFISSTKSSIAEIRDEVIAYNPHKMPSKTFTASPFRETTPYYVAPQYEYMNKESDCSSCLTLCCTCCIGTIFIVASAIFSLFKK